MFVFSNYLKDKLLSFVRCQDHSYKVIFFASWCNEDYICMATRASMKCMQKRTCAKQYVLRNIVASVTMFWCSFTKIVNRQKNKQIKNKTKQSNKKQLNWKQFTTSKVSNVIRYKNNIITNTTDENRTRVTGVRAPAPNHWAMRFHVAHFHISLTINNISGVKSNSLPRKVLYWNTCETDSLPRTKVKWTSVC